MSNEMLRSIAEIVAWIVTVAVPAGLAICSALKNKRYRQAVDDFIEVIEMTDDKKLKDRLDRQFSGKTKTGVIDPALSKKGYLKQSAEKEDNSCGDG